MKTKLMLFVCAFALAALCCGCGAAPSAPPAQDTSASSGAEVSQDDTSTAEELSQEDASAEEAEEPQTDPAEEALLAYQEILSAAPAIEGEHEELNDAAFGYDENLALFGDHFELYALADLNQDGIPELLAQSVVNFRWTPVCVYTYAGGEAVLLKDPLNPEAHGTFEQQSTANGGYNTYICDENHLHNVWRGADPMGEPLEENHAYTLEGTALTEVDCAVEESDDTVYFYDIAKTNSGSLTEFDGE